MSRLALQTRIKFKATNLQSFRSSPRVVAVDIGYVLKSLQPHKAIKGTVKACLRMRSLSSPIACLVAACCLHGRVHENVLQKDTVAILPSYTDAENTTYLYLFINTIYFYLYLYCYLQCASLLSPLHGMWSQRSWRAAHICVQHEACDDQKTVNSKQTGKSTLYEIDWDSVTWL